MSTMKRVLLSIKSEHADNIMSKRKTVELRKDGFPEDCKLMVLYCTSPIKRILGEVEVDHVLTGSKETIWLMYGSQTCITKEQFDAYYKGQHWASAIVIKQVLNKWSFDPKKVFEKFHAPMSWMYLSDENWMRIHMAAEGKI